MPAAAWPSIVPHCFIFDSMSTGVGNGLLASDNDMGPPKVRRRFTAVTRELNGILVMTYDELAALETFVADELVGGSLPFTFSDQRGGSDLLCIFDPKAQDLLPWKRFAAGKVQVQLQLLVLP